MSAEYMWNNRIGNCWNRTYFTTYLLRSIGIPCGVDYLKQAPKSATNHCWSFIVDTTGLTCDLKEEIIECLLETVLLHFMS